MRAQIAQAMARAVAQLELAKRRVALAQRAIDLANENIRSRPTGSTSARRRTSTSSTAQEELRQAELRKAQAMIDWHKAEAVVQALTGDILPTTASASNERDVTCQIQSRICVGSDSR